MRRQAITHHYTECGLPGIWIECARARDDAGEDTFIIPNIRGLHNFIARMVVLSARALSGAEIRFLRSEMGLDRDAFGGLVYRRGSTVAQWENGQSAPDAAIDVLIRIIATLNLKLNIDLEKSIGEWKSAAGAKRTPAKKIRIQTTRRGEYRLAA